VSEATDWLASSMTDRLRSRRGESSCAGCRHDDELHSVFTHHTAFMLHIHGAPINSIPYNLLPITQQWCNLIL